MDCAWSLGTPSRAGHVRDLFKLGQVWVFRGSLFWLSIGRCHRPTSLSPSNSGEHQPVTCQCPLGLLLFMGTKTWYQKVQLAVPFFSRHGCVYVSLHVCLSNAPRMWIAVSAFHSGVCVFHYLPALIIQTCLKHLSGVSPVPISRVPPGVGSLWKLMPVHSWQSDTVIVSRRCFSSVKTLITHVLFMQTIFNSNSLPVY